MNNAFLDVDRFQLIIESTPLISIDLLIVDSCNRFLLGRRINQPARGFWFVPGGRVMKNETLSDAFRRIVSTELGVEKEISDASYIGLYEHFYKTSYMSDAVSTHYIVNAFQFELPNDRFQLPIEQHCAYRWFNTEELLESEQVHNHTKWYFMSEKGYSL